MVTLAQTSRDLIIQHASWVQGEANKRTAEDAVLFIAKSGFQQAKVGRRTPVTSPEVTNTDVSGTVHYEVPSVPGARLYFCEVSTDGGKTYPRVIEFEHIRGEIPDVTPGVLTYFRFRTYVRGSGSTGWSQDVKLIVT